MVFDYNIPQRKSKKPAEPPKAEPPKIPGMYGPGDTITLTNYTGNEVGFRFGTGMESPEEKRLERRFHNHTRHGLSLRKVVVPDMYIAVASCGGCCFQFHGLDALERWANECEEYVTREYDKTFMREYQAKSKAPVPKPKPATKQSGRRRKANPRKTP